MRRLLVDNPGPFTFKGTLSYIVGRGQVAIIDPGPLDEAAYRGAARRRARRDRHPYFRDPHPSRSFPRGAARSRRRPARLVLAEGPHRAARPLNVGEAPRLDASNDTEFRPDRALADGEVVTGAGWTIEAVATPGHTANHMAFALEEANLLFSGDHVMAWSTPVVAPPDGAMSDYMASLQKLARRSEDDLSARPRRRRARGAALRAALHPPPPRPRGVDPAPAGQGRSRHPDHRARDLYRARSAAHQGGGSFGARPSRGSGDARAGRDRRTALDRWPLPLGADSTSWADPSCRARISCPAAPSPAAAPASAREWRPRSR